MIWLDLTAVGVPYKEADSRQFAFQALRHQFITDLANAGVRPKTAQALTAAKPSNEKTGVSWFGISRPFEVYGKSV